MSDPRTPSAGGPQPPGATSIGAEQRKSRKGLWLALAAIAAVIALLLLLSRCGGDDDPQSAGSAASASATGSTSSAAGPSGSSDSGTSSPATGGAGGTTAPGGAAGSAGDLVTADGRSVLELGASADPSGGLGSATGQAVTGSAVQVLTVPADEGFWVGTSDADRVWVQLTGASGESPYTVQEGDSVDFTGSVVPHDAGFADQVGVDEAEGASQLTGQAAHLEVPRSGLVLAD